MYTYREIKSMFEAGLISRDEANKMIDFLNMGSDTRYYKAV